MLLIVRSLMLTHVCCHSITVPFSIIATDFCRSLAEKGVFSKSSQIALVAQFEKLLKCASVKIKDGAYFCYCTYDLRISRYSSFLWVVPTNTGIFLRGLKPCGESRTQQVLLVFKIKIWGNHTFFRDNKDSIWKKKNAIHCFVFYCFF